MADRDPDSGHITLFLCGDVMTGRGIDQILPYPADPMLCESFMESAVQYVELAEAASGPIPRPVPFPHIWGDVLDELTRQKPAARIVNLETSITDRGRCAPKGINYRMSGRNLPCLTAAGIDCCVLANNHVLDWGHVGLEDTLDSLTGAGIRIAGAGRDARQASLPAVIERDGQGRILVLGCGLSSSGIPVGWRATEKSAGVNLIEDLSARTVSGIAAVLDAVRKPGDVVVVSIHWGGNWGYELPEGHVRFAHALIDEADVHVVHGHSSHHAKAAEVYNGRLVLYGCGDFINDYEGIQGHEAFRSDLAVAYFPRIARSGRLVGMRLIPFQIRRFRLARASVPDTAWLATMFSRQGERFRTAAHMDSGGALLLAWA